jgi:salicylate hydroxylase
MAVHRVDLHNELLRLALDGEDAASLRLGTKMNKVDDQKGVIELDDGSVHQADLIIAADGLHSFMRSAVLKQKSKPSPTGLSAFRFLIPTDKMESDDALRKLLKWKVQGSTIMADTTDTVNERHLVWYSCQGYKFQRCG